MSETLPLKAEYNKDLKTDDSNNQSNQYIRAWILFSIFSGMVYGYNCSIASVLPSISKRFQWNTSGIEYASSSSTFMEAVSAVVLGGPLLDRIGRRTTGMIAGIMSAFGCFFIGFVSVTHISNSPSWYFLICRACTGIGNGLSVLVLPIYICESVCKQTRGMLISIFQGGVMFGILLPYAFLLIFVQIWGEMDTSMNITTTNNDIIWRITLMIGSLPGLCILCCFICCSHIFCESKHWERSIESNENETIYIQQENNYPKIPCLVGLGILLAYSNNSVDSFLYYGTLMVDRLGESSSIATKFGASVCILSIVGIIGATFLLAKGCSRRQMLLISFGIMILFYMLSAIFMTIFFHSMTSTSWILYCILICLCISTIFYNLGPGPMCLLIVSELFPNARTRGRLVSLCTFSMSCFAFLINGTMITFFDTFGMDGTLYIYGSTYIICWIIYFFWLPETRYHSMR